MSIFTEILLNEVHILHLEGTAVQVFQGAGVGGKRKDQLVGVQGLTVTAQPAVVLLAAVFAVADEGMARGGELGADLDLLPTFLAIGIDELSVSPASVLPLRAEIRKSIAKTCTLEKLEC